MYYKKCKKDVVNIYGIRCGHVWPCRFSVCFNLYQLFCPGKHLEGKK